MNRGRLFPAPQPKPPAVVPAAIAMLAAEKLESMPLGGWGGETLVAPADPAPPPPAPEPFIVEPWPEEERLRAMQDNAEPPDPAMTAHQAMMAAALARGEVDWPEVPGPPLQLPPLERPRFPEPDWRAEQLERARLEEHGLLEERPRIHPPPRRELT